jgi:hypothetical protein
MDGLRGEQLLTLFRWFKEGPPGAVPIEHNDRSIGVLVAVTWEDAGCSAAAGRLAAWHESAQPFPEPFPATSSGARQWLVERVLQTTDRVLFWVKDVRGQAVGHVGLSELDANEGRITVADVLCGAAGHEGLMAAAVNCLTDWLQSSLQLTARLEGERLAA